MGDKRYDILEGVNKENLELFVKFVEERESINMKRSNGEPGPWSDDIAFQKYSFCNMNRSDDRGTMEVEYEIKSRDIFSWQPHELVSAIFFMRFMQKPKLSMKKVSDVCGIAGDMLGIFKMFDGGELFQTLLDIDPKTYMEIVREKENNYKTGTTKKTDLPRIFDDIKEVMEDFKADDDIIETLKQVKGIGNFLATQIVLDIRNIFSKIAWSFVMGSKLYSLAKSSRHWDAYYHANGTQFGYWCLFGKSDGKHFVRSVKHSKETIIHNKINLKAHLYEYIKKDEIAGRIYEALEGEPYNINNMLCEFNKYMLIQLAIKNTGKLPLLSCRIKGFYGKR